MFIVKVEASHEENKNVSFLTLVIILAIALFVSAFAETYWLFLNNQNDGWLSYGGEWLSCKEYADSMFGMVILICLGRTLQLFWVFFFLNKIEIEKQNYSQKTFFLLGILAISVFVGWEWPGDHLNGLWWILSLRWSFPIIFGIYWVIDILSISIARIKEAKR